MKNKKIIKTKCTKCGKPTNNQFCRSCLEKRFKIKHELQKNNETIIKTTKKLHEMGFNYHWK